MRALGTLHTGYTPKKCRTCRFGPYLLVNVSFLSEDPRSTFRRRSRVVSSLVDDSRTSLRDEDSRLRSDRESYRLLLSTLVSDGWSLIRDHLDPSPSPSSSSRPLSWPTSWWTNTSSASLEMLGLRIRCRPTSRIRCIDDRICPPYSCIGSSDELESDLSVKKHSVDRAPRKDRSSLTDVSLPNAREKKQCYDRYKVNNLISSKQQRHWGGAARRTVPIIIVWGLNLQRTLDKRRWKAERSEWWRDDS